MIESIPAPAAPQADPPPPHLVPAQPVSANQRLGAMDLLRGFALCGILLMNIVNFAWPGGAYTSVTFPYYSLQSIGEVPDPEIRDKEIAKAEKDFNRKQKDKNRKQRELEPKPQYALGDLRWCAVSSDADLYEFAFADLLVDNKMRTLFSMLFGAGVILMADHSKGKRNRPGWLHYRRMFWLLVLGAAHGYLLWTGDILFAYAAIGLWLYPLRKLRARWLCALGLGLLLTPLAIAWFAPNVIEWVKEKGRSVEQNLEAIEKQTAENPPTSPDNSAPQESAVEPEKDELYWLDAKFLAGYRALDAMRKRGPRPDLVTLDIRKQRTQTYSEGVVERFWDLIWAQLAELIVLGFLALGWPMVLGMALMKLGFFTGNWTTKSYGWWTVCLYVIGIPMTWWALILSTQGGNSVATQVRMILPLEWIGSLLLTLANASALLWLWKTNRINWLASRLQAAGQMALSNYLFDSLLCSFIFSGYGLAFYGTIPRVGLAALVAAIWVFQLTISPWWLEHFRFGPVEWLWRSLTYWKIQPLLLVSSPKIQPQEPISAS